MLQEIIARFMAYIVDDLVRIFQMVMHDSVETWNHDIYHEFRRNNGINQNLAPRA